MVLETTYLIYFSPTHTSKQVARAIVRGIGSTSVNTLDLTLNPADDIVLPASSLAVIVVPVYGGRVAPLAMERLQGIRGMDTPVVLVVVYGNRAYEKALAELDEYAVLHGFKVVAGATFVGEHSYSTEKNPIAVNRPDAADLEFACTFGQQIARKIENASDVDTLYPVEVRAIPRPRQPLFPMLRFIRRVMALRKSGQPLPRTPWLADESLCTHCGYCALHCPAKAIAKDNVLHTDAEKCIKCCACVKGCPAKARVYDTPFADLLSKYFRRPKDPKTLL